MKTTFINTLICVSGFLGFASYGMEESSSQKWTPAGTLTDNERRQHLADHLHLSLNKSSQDVLNLFGMGLATQDQVAEAYFAPGIHTFLLPDFGRTFSFDGTADIKFCEELQKSQNAPITILFPAAGFGRSVLDTLALNNQAEIIFNDIQPEFKDKVEELLSKHGYKDRKVTFLMGDIFQQIESLKENSIDIIYSANLIHYLNPFDVENLLHQFSRVLKPNGKIFLLWRGTSDTIEISKGYSAYDYQETIKILEKLRIKFPTYLEKKYGNGVYTFSSDYPYYPAMLKDVVEHANRTGYEVLEKGQEIPVVLAMQVGTQFLMMGDYRTESDKFTVPISVVMNYLILKRDPNNHSSIKPVGKEEQIQFFKERERDIENFRCHNCNTLSEKLLKCSVCKTVSYCNKDCQRNDWKSHKPNCKPPVKN